MANQGGLLFLGDIDDNGDYHFSFSSHPSRHRAHGQELDVGVWVFGTRPEAIHGRLWRHPLHEQCQTLPLPGKKHSSFDQIVSFSTEMFQCFLFLVNILTSGKFMGYSNETGKFGLPNFQNNANLPSSVQTWTIKSWLTLHCRTHSV